MSLTCLNHELYRASQNAVVAAVGTIRRSCRAARLRFSGGTVTAYLAVLPGGRTRVIDCRTTYPAIPCIFSTVPSLFFGSDVCAGRAPRRASISQPSISILIKSRGGKVAFSILPETISRTSSQESGSHRAGGRWLMERSLGKLQLCAVLIDGTPFKDRQMMRRGSGGRTGCPKNI